MIELFGIGIMNNYNIIYFTDHTDINAIHLHCNIGMTYYNMSNLFAVTGEYEIHWRWHDH